jgi:hypothetical protein
MFHKVVKNLNSLSGWQRVWILISSLFSLTYLFIFLILPLFFSKSFSYSLPFQRDINYEKFDFPTYSQIYFIDSENWSDTLFFNQAKISSSEWLKSKFPNLIDKTLFEDGMHKSCFGDDIIDLKYSSNGIFKPIKFTTYHYTNFTSDYICEPIQELPNTSSDSSKCWIAIHINNKEDKDFLYFYRPLSLSNNEETVMIAEFLNDKLSMNLLLYRTYWLVKFLLISTIFSFFIYLIGIIFNWLIKGFK